jgi:hypothetical protein
VSAAQTTDGGVKPLKSEMAFEILAYLVRHPKAQDTFEGILEWWLLERHIERQRLALVETMEELVDSGLVIARQGRDRRERYRLNPLRCDEAQALVTRREDARPGKV